MFDARPFGTKDLSHPLSEAALAKVPSRKYLFPVRAADASSSNGGSSDGTVSVTNGIPTGDSKIPSAATKDPASFLCTQSFGGSLTHFFAETYYAVDFRTPVGTVVVAVGPGIVKAVIDSHSLTGINIKNLFSVNSFWSCPRVIYIKM